jgi:hypothetical protein
MNTSQLSFPTRAVVRCPDFATCLHRRNIAWTCACCTSDRLEAIKRLPAAAQRCKGCGRPIGRWVDYCGECTPEDETDCW